VDLKRSRRFYPPDKSEICPHRCRPARPTGCCAGRMGTAGSRGKRGGKRSNFKRNSTHWIASDSASDCGVFGRMRTRWGQGVDGGL